MTQPLKYLAPVQQSIVCVLLVSLLFSEAAIIYEPHIFGSHQVQPNIDTDEAERTLPSLSYVDEGLLPSKHQSLLESPRPKTEIRSPQSRVMANKFILLTDGVEIKLYPLQTTGDAADFMIISNVRYTVKPIEFNLTASETHLAMDFDSPYLRWLYEKQAYQERTKNDNHELAIKRPISILPIKSIAADSNYQSTTDQQASDEDVLYQGASGWQRPWISEVDYFFDPYFCQHALGTCLVIVWLDKRNKFVRFGSVLLHDSRTIELDKARHKTTTMTSTINVVNDGKRRQSARPTIGDSNDRVIWLREFPPIDVCRLVASLDYLISDCEVSGFVVDKTRGTMDLILGSKDQFQDRILSGKFHPELRRNHQFKVENYAYFDSCLSDKAKNDINLLLDENSGRWMFYVSKNPFDSQIIAMDRNRAEFIDHQGSFKFAVQAKVFDMSRCPKSQSSIQALAIDNKNHQLYWLLNNNELFASDYSGSRTKLVVKLSAKPVIRKPDRMQFFHDKIFISDRSKKSIIVYNLKGTDKNNSTNINSYWSTHQVLLIEMSGIQAFRLVDLHDSILEDTLDYEQIDERLTPDIKPSLSSILSRLFGVHQEKSKESSAYDRLAARARVGLCHNLAGSYWYNSVLLGYLAWLFASTVIFVCCTYCLIHMTDCFTGIPIRVFSKCHDEQSSWISIQQAKSYRVGELEA